MYNYGISGYGADLQATGSSTAILKDTTITTQDVIRPCTSATEHFALIVRNCVLDAAGGVSDRTKPRAPGDGKAMGELPADL